MIGSVNQGVVPLKAGHLVFDNETSEEEYGTMERALLYVAVTRAKKTVHISYYGQQSELIG